MKKKLLVALSGGGVRSASCAYGFLRELERFEYKFDKLSSVSGGGYAVAKYLFGSKDELPALKQRMLGSLMLDVLFSLLSFVIVCFFSISFNSIWAHDLGWINYAYCILCIFTVVGLLILFFVCNKYTLPSLIATLFIVVFFLFTPYAFYLLYKLFDLSLALKYRDAAISVITIFALILLFCHAKIFSHRYYLQYFSRLTLNICIGGFFAYLIFRNVVFYFDYAWSAVFSFYIIFLQVIFKDFLSEVHRNYSGYVREFASLHPEGVSLENHSSPEWIVNFTLHNSHCESLLTLNHAGVVFCNSVELSKQQEDYIRNLSVLDRITVSGAAADTARANSLLSLMSFFTSGTGVWLLKEKGFAKIKLHFLEMFGAMADEVPRLTDGGFVDNLGLCALLLGDNSICNDAAIVCLDSSYDPNLEFEDLKKTSKMLWGEGVVLDLKKLSDLRASIESGEFYPLEISYSREGGVLGSFYYIKLCLPYAFAKQHEVSKLPKEFPHITTNDQSLRQNEIDSLVKLGEFYAGCFNEYAKK